MSEATLRIIGIDPGSLVTGYGIIDKNGSRLSFVGAGCIRNRSDTKLPARFAKIYSELKGIFEEYRPDQAAVEGLFFCRNVKTAIKLGEARGITMLVAAETGIEVFEYAPRRVKQSVSGKGGAKKPQVQYMVKTILNMGALPQPHDAADALALALCHAFSIKDKV